MSWDAYNRRKEVLHHVLVIADRRRGGATATDLLAEVAGAIDVFGNEVELLLDTQMIWYQALSGRMDQMLLLGAADPEAGAIAAWHDIAALMPGVRALLDANTDNPDLQRAYAKEREFLALAAGVPANHPDLEGHGERIKRRACAAAVYDPYEPPRESSFFSRIRGLRAA